MEIIQTLILIAVLIAVIRLRLTNKKTPVKSAGKQIVLDSCALIDGRIIDLAQSGFVSQPLVVPQFVISELQLLADGGDTQKRARARFGLDVAKSLQDITSVKIDRSNFETIKAVDDKLVALAKKINADLYTTDFNLNKVASIEGVQVLNVHELAQNLRPSVLPGEVIKLKIVQKGSSKNQGVGYLDDGTMVVIDDAQRFVGKFVDAQVSRMHQTVAGKMVFGSLLPHRSDLPPAKDRRTVSPRGA